MRAKTGYFFSGLSVFFGLPTLRFATASKADSRIKKICPIFSAFNLLSRIIALMRQRVTPKRSATSEVVSSLLILKIYAQKVKLSKILTNGKNKDLYFRVYNFYGIKTRLNLYI